MTAADDRTLEWAREQLREQPKLPPRYGSQEWWDEPDGLVRRMSIIAAAECWRGESLPEEITRRLDAELQGRRQAVEDHLDWLFEDAQRIVRSLVKRHDGLTYAERRARELEEARRPRPGDFPGINHRRTGVA